jgi:hypothetical protein
MAAARAMLSDDESDPFDTVVSAGAYEAKRDAALRDAADVVEVADVNATINTDSSYFVSNAHRGIGGQFSPAETRSLIEAALYVLRDPPRRPQHRSPYSTGPAFRAAQARALANGDILGAAGLEIEVEPPEPDDCFGVLECALGGIEQRLSGLGLNRADDEHGGHLAGFQLFERKDTVIDRRSKVNVDKDSRDRAALREAARNDCAAFAKAIPSDIADRITVPDYTAEAHRLLDSIVDERGEMRWLRDEAVADLKARHEWCSPWGRASTPSLWASAYFNIIAGRLVAEGYTPLPARVRRRSLPAVAVGKYEAAGARGLDADVSVEQLDEIMAAGTEPIVALPCGVVITLRKKKLPAPEKYGPKPYRPKPNEPPSRAELSKRAKAKLYRGDSHAPAPVEASFQPAKS